MDFPPPRRARLAGRVLALSLCTLLILTATTHAQPFYVATDGSDADGNGSASAPWATITHALDTVPDGSTVLVEPGRYDGRVRLRGSFSDGVVVRSETPYQARLRHDGPVVTCYYGRGITLSGFDIAHDGPGADPLVVQIQDLISGPDAVRDIVLRNNVIHDSYDNDLLKVNNGARSITIEGNMFYNQSGSDEHIDVNSVEDVVVEGNVFFNDFAGSGRPPQETSSFIVIKDSNGSDDAYVGSRTVRVQRNVFLNWVGSSGSNFVLVGEDGAPYFEAEDVLVENNLMLGTSDDTMRAPFGVKGGTDITFRHNTVVGPLPSLAFAFRLNTEGSNPANEAVAFYNNVWTDPSGTIDDFSDTPVGETASFTLSNNLYWNGGAPLPSDANDLINVTDDDARIIDDPALPSPDDVTLPRWNPGSGQFADGSASVLAAFERLVTTYGAIPRTSAARDAARPDQSPALDILGRDRSAGSDAGPDVGAYEEPTLLPVELAHFRVTRRARDAVLSWSTRSETNNSGFAVEHAADNGPWHRAGFVEGMGTTPSGHPYAFRLADLPPGRHRVRLRQIDTDGTASLSPVRTITMPHDASMHLTAPAPHPVSQETRLTLTVDRTQRVQATLIDALGRRVRHLLDARLSAATSHPLVIDATSLPSGVYVVRVDGDTFSTTRRVVVVH